MALHRLTSITIGVPDVAPTAVYYEEFGLMPTATGGFATIDGGEQLRLVSAPQRRLLELGVGVDHTDDIDRIAAALAKVDVPASRTPTAIVAIDRGTEVQVSVRVAARIEPAPAPAAPTNGPGRASRSASRADAVLRTTAVRPRKLGHVVLGTTDFAASERFFLAGIGFKVSDTVAGLASFLRCSTDHHNLLVQPAPIPLLHHTSWQVDDVDEIGRGAHAMLTKDPGRHVWGLGRHYIGSNFFWYLKDPAGNFTEYYADLDCIVDDELWSPGVWEGAKSLYAWGPPVPPSFLAPDDLAALMAGRSA